MCACGQIRPGIGPADRPHFDHSTGPDLTIRPARSSTITWPPLAVLAAAIGRHAHVHSEYANVRSESRVA